MSSCVPAPHRDRPTECRHIRAAVLRAAHAPLELERLELEPPREDEVLVRIVAAGICRTDIDLCAEHAKRDGPVVLGHEGAGVVEQMGARVKRVRRGDHVVLSYASCGRCHACRSGHPAHCAHFYEANFGFRRLDGSNALAASGVGGHFFGQSSFATCALTNERNVVKVPTDLPLALLAPLGCGMQTGAGTVLNTLCVRKEASLAVFGAGAVGLAAVMAARAVRAEPIVAVDRVAARLALALELGATHVLDTRRGRLLPRVAAIAEHGLDYVLETTGDPRLEGIGAELLAPRGTLAMIARPDGNRQLPGRRKIVSVIQGDAVPQRFIPRMIALYRAGRFPLERLVRTYPFSAINRAIADAERGRTIKPVLLMNGR